MDIGADAPRDCSHALIKPFQLLLTWPAVTIMKGGVVNPEETTGGLPAAFKGWDRSTSVVSLCRGSTSEKENMFH